MELSPRSPNGFLSSLSADDFELIRPHLKTVDLVQANGKKSINSLVIGEVVNIHIDDAVITDGNIDMARIRPIARLGYMDYSVVDTIFTMHRVPAQ